MKTRKWLFGSSIVLNIVLIIIVAIGYVRISIVHEVLFFQGVQQKLVELEGLIDQQKKNGWDEPNLVTTQLSDVLEDLNLAIYSGQLSGWLSDDDKYVLERLVSLLRQYPHDELYQFSEVNDVQLKQFESLQLMLREAGVGLRIQQNQDWDYFMWQLKSLLERIEEAHENNKESN